MDLRKHSFNGKYINAIIVNYFVPTQSTMNKVALLFAFLSIQLNSFSQSAPKYSNEFLTLGVGAPALAMGGAQVSQVNDVTAGYWNPAGLVHTKGDIQLALMHNEYFAGIGKYDYGAFTAAIDTMHRIGISILRFGIDDIANTIELKDSYGNVNYDRITGFSAADYAFIFSYAGLTRMQGLSYGANAKIIYRKVGDFAKAWGFGLDVGIQYNKGNWKFGVMAKDVTSTFNAWSYTLNDRTKEVFVETGNEIPENGLELTLPRLIIGASHQFNLNKFTITPALDLETTFDKKRNTLVKSNFVSIDPHMGIEAGYNHFIFLRAGINNVQDKTNIEGKKSKIVQPNFGIGIKLNNLSIDYALTNIGNNTNLYSNVFSLRLIINKQNKS